MVCGTRDYFLIGGDQLIAERVCSARMVRQNSTHAMGTLEGQYPKAGMQKFAFYKCGYNCDITNFNYVIVQVMWKHHYKNRDSFSEACTMPQLQSLINRSNVPHNI